MGEGLKRAFKAAEATRIVITPKRLWVLRIIKQECDRQSGVYPNHHKIAVACGKSYSAADWAHEPLRALHRAGMIEAVGKDKICSRLWRLTAKGETYLSENTRSD